MKSTLFGIGGVARSGKDSFANLLLDHVQINLGQGMASHAFAQELKREIDPFLKARHGISAFTRDSNEKAIIRPDLVAWGKMRRDESNGTHWIRQIESLVTHQLACGVDVIITDVRFNTHDRDELAWIKSLGGKVVYIERVLLDGSILPPANEEEAANTFKVREAADLIVTVPTFLENHLDNMRPFVLNAYSQLTS